MRKIYFLLMALTTSTLCWGQLVTTNSAPYNTAASLVNNVLVDGVTVSNITFTGNIQQIGYFDGTNSNIGLDSGIVLTTGHINVCPGPNNSGSAGQSVSGGSGLSYPALQAISGVNMNDLAMITFDFVPVSDSIQFRYVFASEEYAEYVGGGVNDAFGFFLSGPNPFGGTYVDENLAIVPGSVPPLNMSINEVNCQAGSPYYICNDPNNFLCPPSYSCPGSSTGTTVQYDGITTVMTARAAVVCGETYTIRLAIADGGDQVFDSGVFLEAGSFRQIDPVLSAGNPFPNADNDSTVHEGCDYTSLIFTTQDAAFDTVMVYYNIAGTAINGTDYDSLPGVIPFYPGMTQKSIIIRPKKDALIEGDETVIISIIDSGCVAGGGIKNYVIKDNAPLTVNVPDTIYFCDYPVIFDMDASVITGGTPPYHYQWSYKGELYTNPNFIGYTWEQDSAHLYIYDDCYEGQTFEKLVWFVRPDTCPEPPPPVDSVHTLVFPNTFSPNGDGLNDMFYVRGLATHGVANIVIFNRWGEKVYENPSFELCEDAACWDGKDMKSGNDLAEGVYFYQIVYESDGETKTQKGEVTLFR